MSDLILHPIGTVIREGERTFLRVEEAFRPGLRGLEGYSHLLILWWFGRQPPAAQRLQRPSADGRMLGVFATRSPHRPNPIGCTVARLLAVDEASGLCEIDSIEAFDGTPLLDLKGYSPAIDSVPDAVTPGSRACPR